MNKKTLTPFPAFIIGILFPVYLLLALMLVLNMNRQTKVVEISPVEPSPPEVAKVASSDAELLPQPWNLNAQSDAVEKYQTIDKDILKGKDIMEIKYDLHGLCALGDDASAIIFDQNEWKYVSLSNYGQNCKDGEQTITLSLSDFKNLNTNSPLTGTLHTRFWNNKPYNVEIKSIIVKKSSITPVTTTPTPKTPTIAQPDSSKTWSIQSVDAMKYTKDVICNQKDEVWINKWVGKAAELGATHVAISTPYDNPKCGDAVAYTKTWIKAIRAKGLKVFHRQMPLQFEGIYDNPKSPGANFTAMVTNYIKTNKENYQEGDIFTPIPEPQNGGIKSVNNCAQGVCIFSSTANFNQWLRDTTIASREAFGQIGLKDKVGVGYYGFDGFIAWGHNNPDWQGKGFLEDETVRIIGHIAVDHYPEAVGTEMGTDLAQLEKRFPNTPIIISEWGTIKGGNIEQQVKNSMGGAKRPSVVGFNYWHLGPGGNEALINDDFTNRPQFNEVQSFFKPKK